MDKPLPPDYAEYEHLWYPDSMPLITDYTITTFDVGASENQSISDILLDVTERFAFVMTSKQVSRPNC